MSSKPSGGGFRFLADRTGGMADCWRLTDDSCVALFSSSDERLFGCSVEHRSAFKCLVLTLREDFEDVTGNQ